MHSGQVKCCGSTIFLKKIYHVGYLLRLQLSKENKKTELLFLIKEYIPDASYESQQANDLFFRLTLNVQNSEANNLNLMIAKLFDCFESLEVKMRFGIEAYGLTNTTLEDVFIKIGTLDLPNENAIAIENAEDHPLHNLNRLTGPTLFLQQFLAIFDKKFKLTYKNLPLFVSSIYPLVLPVCLILCWNLIISTYFIRESFTYDTFNIKQTLGPGMEMLQLGENEFDEKSNLFRKANHDWIKKEFGFEIVSSSDQNSEKATANEILRIGIETAKAKLLFSPKQTNTLEYNFKVNPTKFPYSLVSLIEMFYRLIARDLNHDSNFDVNLKFSFFKAKENDAESEFRTAIELIGYLTISKIILNLVSMFFISIMFSFYFIAFVEILHDEMNSGVSVFIAA